MAVIEVSAEALRASCVSSTVRIDLEGQLIKEGVSLRPEVVGGLSTFGFGRFSASWLVIRSSDLRLHTSEVALVRNPRWERIAQLSDVAVSTGPGHAQAFGNGVRRFQACVG
jgi:hypothetical protein